MSGDYRPRENDHLVEPMFDALREPSPVEDGAPRRRRWTLGWALAVVAAALAGLAAAFLLAR